VLAFALERVPSVVAESLPFAFALLGVALFLAAARPEWVVVLGFALLAFVRQEPAPVDVVFAVLLVAVLFWRRESLRLPPLVSVLLFALAVVTLLSMVNADDFGRAIRFEAITLYMIALGVCLTTVFASADLTRRAVSAYIIVAALSALAAAIALEIGIPGGTYLIYGSNNLRAQGLFKDPNVFAPFLVPAAVIVLEEMVRPRLLGWRMRWKLAVFIVLTLGIVLAFSRGAWVNMAVAVATVVLIYTFRRRGLRAAAKALAVLLVSALVGLSLLIGTGSLGFFESRSGEQSYDQSRFGAQGVAFDRTADHVFGYGPGQVEGALHISAHSLYARLAFEQGLLGISIIILLGVVTLVFALLLVARDQDIHGIGSAALLGAWLGMLANSLVIDTLHWRHLWIVAALIWAGYAQHRLRAQKRFSSPAGGLAGALEAGPASHRGATDSGGTPSL
jgi:hypothetical protein